MNTFILVALAGAFALAGWPWIEPVLFRPRYQVGDVLQIAGGDPLVFFHVMGIEAEYGQRWYVLQEGSRIPPPYRVLQKELDANPAWVWVSHVD